MVRAAPPMTSRNSVAKGHSTEDRRLAPLRTSTRRSARRNCSGGVARNGIRPLLAASTRPETHSKLSNPPPIDQHYENLEPACATSLWNLVWPLKDPQLHSLFFILRIRDRQVPELLAVVRNGDSSPQSDSASVHHHVEFSSCIRKGVCPYSFSNPSSF